MARTIFSGFCMAGARLRTGPQSFVVAKYPMFSPKRFGADSIQMPVLRFSRATLTTNECKNSSTDMDSVKPRADALLDDAICFIQLEQKPQFVVPIINLIVRSRQ